MRPLRLHVEGFTSFRVPVEIDFSALQLFAITGPTGSGKTSILDAVTLALYGKVPRARKRDLKELISLGASEAKVQLDFLVGKTQYRVARRIPRRGAQVATVQRLEGEALVPEVERSGVTAVNSRLVEILGLDYNSFTTAVLLPQGDFAEFLKGDVEARRKILIRLLDLDRFRRAGERAREKAKELKLAVATSQRLLEKEYGDVTQEALEAICEEARTAEEIAEAAEDAADEARTLLAERKNVAARSRDVGSLASTLEVQCQELKELASSWTVQAAGDAETQTAVETTRREQTKAQAERERARDALKAVVEETGSAVVLAKLQSDALSLRNAERQLEGVSENLELNAKDLRRAMALRDQLAVRLEAKNRFKADTADNLQAATLARRGAQKELGIAGRANTLNQDLVTRQQGVQTLRDQLATVKLARDVAVRLREEIEEQLRVKETAHQATSLRADLSLGDSCPVCDAPVTELLPTDEPIESDLAICRAAVTEARKNATQSEKKVSALGAQLVSGESTVDDIETKLRDLGRSSPLAEAQEVERRRKTEEKEAQERLDEAETKLGELKQQMADGKARIAGLEATRSADQNTEQKVRGRMARVSNRLITTLGKQLQDPIEVIEERHGRLAKATSVRDAADESCERAEAGYRHAMERRSSMLKELASLDGRLSEQRTLLSERRAQLIKIGASLPSTRAMGDQEDRWEEIRQIQKSVGTLCDAASEAAARLRAKLDMLDDAIQARASDAGIETRRMDPETATASVENAARHARQIADQRRNAVGALEERLGRKGEMQADIEEKLSRMSLYHKVGSELRTNQFIAFLLDESLQDLAMRASTELRRISGEQYSLGASDHNTFEVVDHANGDESRSVVTLSGGETFLASLALALGLAQGIADIAGKSAGARLDAMFVDEGFGSLDPESLHDAVEALERLRDGDRMVGIITHIPALAERIPDGLRLRRPKGVSVVEVR